MRLEYPTDNVDERILTVAAVADPFVPSDVASIEAEAILISPSIRGEVPLAVVEAVRAKAGRVGLDVQGFVRIRTADGRLAYEAWPEMRQVLALVDVLKSDAVEGEFLTGERDLHAIARKLASYGPKEIVLTHKDGLVVLANGTTHAQPFLPMELRGRSGRGDTCVGSYLSRRLSAEPADATRLGRRPDEPQARSGRTDPAQPRRCRSGHPQPLPALDRESSSWIHSRLVFAASLSSIALLIAACTAPTPRGARDTAPQSKAVTLLAFGDGGYHYDHLEKKVYEKVVTEEQFMAKERKDWVEERRPIEEFDHPPMYKLPSNGSVIPATGQMPMAKAMKSYLRAARAATSRVMLGDNIYPDGAMADADDARRFRDVFTTPTARWSRGATDFRIYGVLGNHDWHTSRAGALAQVRFLETTPPFFMDGLFYRVVPAAAHGEVEIFALDTQVLLAATDRLRGSAR